MVRSVIDRMGRNLVTLVDDARQLLGSTDNPIAVKSVDAPSAVGPQSYTLLNNASATGNPVTGVQGGSYIWRTEGTWGGGTATLQILGLDGTTWRNVRNQADAADLTFSANGNQGITIGHGATLRVAITGTAGPISSVLAGVS